MRKKLHSGRKTWFWSCSPHRPTYWAHVSLLAARETGSERRNPRPAWMKAVNNDVVVLYMWKGGFCKSLSLVFFSLLHVFCSLQTRVGLSPTCPLVIGRCRFCLSEPRLPPMELSLSPLKLWPAPSLGLSPAPSPSLSPSFANHTKPKPADPIWCHVFLQWPDTCPRVSQYGPVCSGRARNVSSGWPQEWQLVDIWNVYMAVCISKKQLTVLIATVVFFLCFKCFQCDLVTVSLWYREQEIFTKVNINNKPI